KISGVEKAPGQCRISLRSLRTSFAYFAVRLPGPDALLSGNPTSTRAVAQGAINSRALFQTQRLGPRRGFHPGFGQSTLQLRVGKLGLEVIPESLAFLPEREPQKINEPLACNAQSVHLRVNRQPQQSRIDLGRRRERPRRKGKQLFHPGIQL